MNKKTVMLLYPLQLLFICPQINLNTNQTRREELKGPKLFVPQTAMITISFTETSLGQTHYETRQHFAPVTKSHQKDLSTISHFACLLEKWDGKLFRHILKNQVTIETNLD